MRECYFEVTFRHGKPMAAYYYLPRSEGDTSARVEKRSARMLVDLTSDGRPIGIEISIPSLVTVDAVNAILQSYGSQPIPESELAPLRSAA